MLTKNFTEKDVKKLNKKMLSILKFLWKKNLVDGTLCQVVKNVKLVDKWKLVKLEIKDI